MAAEATTGDGLCLLLQAPGLTVPLIDPQNCLLNRSLLEKLHFHWLPRARVLLARAWVLSSSGRAVTTPSPGDPLPAWLPPSPCCCSRLLFSTKTSRDGSFTLLLPGHQVGRVAQAIQRCDWTCTPWGRGRGDFSIYFIANYDSIDLFWILQEALLFFLLLGDSKCMGKKAGFCLVSYQ